MYRLSAVLVFVELYKNLQRITSMPEGDASEIRVDPSATKCAGNPARRSDVRGRLGRRAGERDEATVGRNVLDQKFHLVRENLPIGENQVLRLVRHVRRVKKLQPRLLRNAVALDSVAGPARRDHVHPRVGAAARYRPDMVSRQPQEAESPSAIRADMAVAAKQLAVVERRHLIETFHRHRLALDRDDRPRGDAGAPARRPGDAAVKNELPLAQRPGDQVLCIVKARLLPSDPAVGHAVIVECQNQRNFARHTKFSITRRARAQLLLKTPGPTIVCGGLCRKIPSGATPWSETSLSR